ncbi:MAG: hypothetical protein RLZZ437_3151 [Pseudomonadota bacterium]
MKRLLCSTTALSMALWPLPTVPAYAQQVLGDGSVVAVDGTVLCVPTAEAACNPADFAGQAQAIEAAIAEQQRAADAAAEAERIANEAAAAAEAERIANEAAAAAEAERIANEAAAEAERIANDAATNAEAERIANEAAAAAEAERIANEAAAEAERIADEAATAAEAERIANEAAAAAEAERIANEAAAEAERQANDAAAEAARLATEAANSPDVQADADAAQAEAERLANEASAAAAAAATTTATEPVVLETVIPEVLNVEIAPDGSEVVVAPQVPLAPTVLIDRTVTPDLAPEAVETLGDLLAAPPAIAAESTAVAVPELVAAPVAEAAVIPLAPDAVPPSGEAAPVVQEQVLTAADTRSSAEEFVTLAPAEPGRRRSGLTDLEKVGLVALGAIVVGAVLSNGNQVVDNTGDRVVVRSSSGQYAVYKDDDALLRRPGTNVRTETYGDGSTRTIVDRGDGTQVVTIRDATGRVLRRATYDSLGREIVLIDDLVEEVRVDVTTLPAPTRGRVTISSSEGDAELKAALARIQAEELGRTFSLRQIREIPQVRALAATVEVNAVTFDSGSAAIKASEAAKLADLGGIVNDLIALNPGEIFLIEGHTDAVGSASSNLTLSDRRAESVARALTEYFNVPPENLVVQGYGEGELLIPTQGDERANRRVAVRIITPLMRSAALQ